MDLDLRDFKAIFLKDETTTVVHPFSGHMINLIATPDGRLEFYDLVAGFKIVQFVVQRVSPYAPPGHAPDDHALFANAPIVDAPVIHAPNSHAPDGQASNGYNPFANAPDVNAPMIHSPNGHAPDGQASFGYNPFADAPVANAPEFHAPDGHAFIGHNPFANAPFANAPEVHASAPVHAPVDLLAFGSAPINAGPVAATYPPSLTAAPQDRATNPLRVALMPSVGGIDGLPDAVKTGHEVVFHRFHPGDEIVGGKGSVQKWTDEEKTFLESIRHTNPPACKRQFLADHYLVRHSRDAIDSQVTLMNNQAKADRNGRGL